VGTARTLKADWLAVFACSSQRMLRDAQARARPKTGMVFALRATLMARRLGLASACWQR